MKNIFLIFSIMLLLIGCKTETSGDMDADMAADEAFMQNTQVVLANLKGWENENLDYSMYADDFYMMETMFNSEADSIDLETMKAADKEAWAMFDFKMLTDPPALLPGVNADTRIPDGSVRHYSEWEVSKAATDSTEARSGVIRLYETFDFDENGKILRQSVYGDFTGIMMYLNSNE